MAKRIGLISDTHGLIRPEVLHVLQGVELILHAGDIGHPDIIAKLKDIAPVVAVKGNVDIDYWANSYNYFELVTMEKLKIYLLHNLNQLKINPSEKEINVVVYGHTHNPKKEIENGVIYINPGSIGSRRFKLPISMAIMEINDSGKVDIDFAQF